MDNQVIQAFKNQVGVEKVLEALCLDFEINGDDAVMCCPFHSEQTPSFRINLESGLHHCFGCDHSGSDIVKFIMELKTLGFVQSLELLSEITEIPLPKEVNEIDKGDLVKRKLIHMRTGYLAEPVETDYTQVYLHLVKLCVKDPAIEYLHGRGICNPEIVVDKMGIRMLDKYDKVNNAMLERFSHARLMQAGIMNERQNLIFYSHRLMLPFLCEESIGYLTARTTEKDCKPKYLNLLDRTIPGFYNTDDCQKNDTLFLCEGQTDVLSLVGLGLPAVGIAGASNIDTKALEILTDKNVIVAFDNDTAGQKGQEKLLKVLQYIAKRVILYPKEEKDILDHVQTKENQEKIKNFYESNNPRR
jgi:DNA primase